MSAKKPAKYTEGDSVEIRYLPGDRTWERATYVRRVQPAEMPPMWRGPRSHVVELKRPGDRRQVWITCQRIRPAAAMPSDTTERAGAAAPCSVSTAEDRHHKWRKTPDGILWAVDKGGPIQPETLEHLLALLREKTDYPHHVAVEVTVGAVLKTIDNENDAQETIRRLDAAPRRKAQG